jgi:hypothetical protein
MVLPGEKGPQVVQVKKVLHDTSLRGRCARLLVCEVDESKSNITIPAPESICPSDRRRSARLQSNPGFYLSYSYFGICAYRFISSLQNYAQDGNWCVYYYRFALVFKVFFLINRLETAI